MLKKYKTILNEGEAQIVEKKSRFITHVKPVQSEEEAKAFWDQLKKKYWDAAHHVFACQIGERNELQRFSDDGEPQGTAGMPVLDVLKGEDVKNTAIVVIRYFGGTLLGTGGLVRAYGKAAKEGLLAAGIAEMVLYEKISLTVPYTDSGKVQYEILHGGYVLLDTVYTDQVTFTVLIEIDQADAFFAHMVDITSGKYPIERKGTGYAAWINGKLEFSGQWKE